MNRLRNRLILVFVAATLLPLCLTLWTTTSLLERSFGLAPLAELDAVSKSLEKTGRELYQQARESLRRDAAEGRITPRHVPPNQAQAFWESGAAEQFELAGNLPNENRGDRLDYYVRHDDEVWIYSRPIGVALGELTHQYAEARQALQTSGIRDFRRGFNRTLLVVAAVLWLAALAALIY